MISTRRTLGINISDSSLFSTDLECAGLSLPVYPPASLPTSHKTDPDQNNIKEQYYSITEQVKWQISKRLYMRRAGKKSVSKAESLCNK